MHRSNAVTEVEIEPGIAHATVTDPDGELHDVSIEVSTPAVGGATPPASDLTTTCSCDDEGDTCTHGLAALLGIAEEIEANGRLLAVWAGEMAPARTTTYTASTSSTSFFDGEWTTAPVTRPLANLRYDKMVPLIVDDLDAGPVVLDAVAAIRSGLSRYRAL